LASIDNSCSSGNLKMASTCSPEENKYWV